MAIQIHDTISRADSTPSHITVDAEHMRVLAVEVECGCCFGDYDVEETVECLEGHPFCNECVRRNAEEALGHRESAITCMDASSELFPSDYSDA